MDLFLLYISFISFITLVIYVIDKRRAIKNKYRIKEKTLLALSFFGGSIGGLIALYVFRHKNKHWYFVFVNVFSFIIHMILAYYIYIKFGFVFV